MPASGSITSAVLRGCRVEGLGFRGVEFRVQGGSRVEGLRVEGPGAFRGVGFRA